MRGVVNGLKSHQKATTKAHIKAGAKEEKDLRLRDKVARKKRSNPKRRNSVTSALGLLASPIKIVGTHLT